MDDLFLRDKTPVFTTMKTKFGMEVFTRTIILPKLEYLFEGEADGSDAVANLMSPRLQLIVYLSAQTVELQSS